MKKFKRITLSLLCILLAVLTASCGEYSPAVGGTNNTGSTVQGSQKPTENGDDPFTVKIMYDGQQYIPTEPIYAHWSDGYSIHNAAFDEKGVASVTGLDGDYKVTLSSIPEGYSYNPNAHKATNINRDIVIEIYKITPTKGSGSGPYSCIEIDKTGMYSAVIESEDDALYYQFTPRSSGMYSVLSWVDVSSDSVNPMIDVYHGSSQFKVFGYTLDDGGECGQYTKNFKHEVKISSDGIGQAFTFAVKGYSKEQKYPITVNFAVQLDGGFERNKTVSTLIVPTEKFRRAPEFDKSVYTFVGAETLDRGNYIFDGSRYGLNEDDGYYHVYNEATGKFDGPVLYAYVSQPCRFLDAAFIHIEMRGNKALTVSNGTENYKLFIEGFSSLLTDPPGDNGPYFCTTDCPCRLDKDCEGACTEGCEKCGPDCRPCPAEAMGKGGYGDYCNSDGVYPVTAELKDFLQKYSTSQLLFFDGNGYVETNPVIKVDAKEEDQWLFACGYYVKK